MTDVPEMVARALAIACAVKFNSQRPDFDPEDRETRQWLERLANKDWPHWVPEARAASEAHEAALAAAGLVIVPREPTEAMAAALREMVRDGSDYVGCSPREAVEINWPLVIGAALGKQP